MISPQLLNALNEMSLMLEAAQKSEWEQVQKLEQGWQDRFQKAFEDSDKNMQPDEKQKILQHIMLQSQQLETLVKNQMDKLRQSQIKDRKRRQDVQRYLQP